jgi:hypothetical protein
MPKRGSEKITLQILVVGPTARQYVELIFGEWVFGEEVGPVRILSLLLISLLAPSQGREGPSSPSFPVIDSAIRRAIAPA